MITNPNKTHLKSVHRFKRLDGFTFKFFTFQYLLVLIFCFFYSLHYAAWGSVPVFILFMYISVTKKFGFFQKVVAIIFSLMLYYTYLYVLYGKSFNFLILPYITPIVALIMMQYKKFMILICTLVVLLVFTINYFEFFGFDYGNNIILKKELYTIWFYFVVIMISLFLIIFLTIRTNIVNDIIEDLQSKNFELEESRVELKKLQTNKESFFAIMSHEIRTPLNAIKGISDILKNNKNDKEANQLLDLMDYSSNHLLALVNNILDFTKLNDGVFSLHYLEFNINNSLNSLFKMNERRALEKGLDYTIQISKNIPKLVYSDKNRINQIVLNLLNNAIEYTNKGKVEMQINGDYNPVKENEFLLKITISDTGKGIEKELGEKLFQKYATSNSTKNSVGLGLTISKGILDLMNGSISFESAPNQGTIFQIVLPLQSIENNPNNSIEVEQNYLEASLKILLVDDNKINLLVLEKQLKNELKNSQLSIAKNGLEALNLIKENQYDIVLMDVIMPVMDGITATSHVRNLADENKKNIPIIALTANVGEKEISECLQVGMNDFVTKPFEIYALMKIIYHQCALNKNKKITYT